MSRTNSACRASSLSIRTACHWTLPELFIYKLRPDFVIKVFDFILGSTLKNKIQNSQSGREREGECVYQPENRIDEKQNPTGSRKRSNVCQHIRPEVIVFGRLVVVRVRPRFVGFVPAQSSPDFGVDVTQEADGDDECHGGQGRDQQWTNRAIVRDEWIDARCRRNRTGSREIERMFQPEVSE